MTPLDEALERAAHLEEKMERALAAVAHFTLRYNEDLETIRTMGAEIARLNARVLQAEDQQAFLFGREFAAAMEVTRLDTLIRTMREALELLQSRTCGSDCKNRFILDKKELGHVPVSGWCAKCIADNVLAQESRAIMDKPLTYELGPDPPAIWIKCLVCGAKSFNPNDVANLYCGKCHLFHLSPLPGHSVGDPL